MLQSFGRMVPDSLLCYLDLPVDLEPMFAVDRFSNFLFLNWPHAAHADYPLTVDLRTAKQYGAFTSAQQRCLLSLLQRAAVIKIHHAWAAQACEWRSKNLNFHLCTSWRGPIEGCPRLGRCRVRGMWHITKLPVFSPLHLSLTVKGRISRICFVLTEYHLACHEAVIVVAVLGALRPSRFLLELTFLLARGGVHLAEVFFAGRLVRQWYFMDAPIAEQQRVTVTFDRTSVGVYLNDFRVLDYEAAWAVAVGHTWDEACLPTNPYFSTAFVLSSPADEVSLVALPTELRTGRAVAE